MSIYSWNHTKKPFVTGGAVEGFSILTFDTKEDEVIATGEIALTDLTAQEEKSKHMRSPWWASSFIVDEKVSSDWLVRKHRDKHRFCAGFIHDALCQFIRGELAAFTENNPQYGHAGNGAPQEPVVVGGIEENEEPDVGLCICREIESSNLLKPFDWRKGNGKRFFRTKGNYRCLVCVCGEQWWQHRPDKEFWTRIVDSTTWHHLVIHHGTPHTRVAYLPGAAYLASTLEARKVPKRHYVLDMTR